MKKIYFILTLFASHFSFAQTNTIVWDWENNATVQRFVNDNCCMLAGGAYVAGVQIPWYATHGCISGCLCISGERIHIDMPAFNSGTPSGRGFAIEYNFKAGYRYTISIDGSIGDYLLQGDTRPYREPTLQVGFTNSINIQTNTLCTNVGVGSVDISSLTSPMATFTGSVYSATMDLTECKDYLWFSSRSNPAGENSGFVDIRKLTITETPIKYDMSGANFICSGSAQYTFPNLPAGASVASWAISPASGICSLAVSGNTATLYKTGNGQVTLTATVNTGCGTQYQAVKGIYAGPPQEAASLVEIYGGGVSEPEFLCPNTSYQVEANFAQVHPEYEWMLPSGWTSTVSGGSNPFVTSNFNIPVHTGSNPSSGFIRVRAKNTCGFGDAAFLNVGIDCNNFRVYPNPANNLINVVPGANGKTRVDITSKNNGQFGNIRSVRIYDMAGRLHNKVNTVINNDRASLDVSLLAEGIYFVEIRYQNKVEKQKLVIKK